VHGDDAIEGGKEVLFGLVFVDMRERDAKNPVKFYTTLETVESWVFFECFGLIFYKDGNEEVQF